MSNKPDVSSREHLQFIVTRFYDQLLVDDVVAHFFSHIHPNDLPHHLERVVDFWYQILFGGDGYNGNPMKPHLFFTKSIPLPVITLTAGFFCGKTP